LSVDLLNRVFLANGLKVNLVINITDVGHLVSDADDGQDKMEKGAQRENLSAWDIAKKYEKAFIEDLDSLNIIRPNHLPRATENIPEMIELIRNIESNGYAYKTDDGIYFDTSKDPAYSSLANLNLAGQESSDRSIVITQKRNRADFALWKFSPKDQQREMEWDSPWGKGFPGWHIECSAMSVKYLGLPFDIHFGGVDHIPVHHTNEIAQTKAATNHILANYWLHNEFLLVEGQKMSKSLGNVFTLKDIVDRGYSPDAFRHLILSASYREKISFTWQSLDASSRAILRLRRLVASGPGEVDLEGKTKALEIINDDLASPKFLAYLEEKNNPWLWLETQNIHGLSLEGQELEINLTDDQKELIRLRQVYRQSGDYEKSDEIREKLNKQGLVIEDSVDGIKISRI
jgi:cysteinyl-tRNA synthetase